MISSPLGTISLTLTQRIGGHILLLAQLWEWWINTLILPLSPSSRKEYALERNMLLESLRKMQGKYDFIVFWKVTSPGTVNPYCLLSRLSNSSGVTEWPLLSLSWPPSYPQPLPQPGTAWGQVGMEGRGRQNLSFTEQSNGVNCNTGPAVKMADSHIKDPGLYPIPGPSFPLISTWRQKTVELMVWLLPPMEETWIGVLALVQPQVNQQI